MAKSKWDKVGFACDPEDALSRAHRVGNSKDIANLLVQGGKSNNTPLDHVIAQEHGYTLSSPSPFTEFRVANNRRATAIFGEEPA